jgi:hypothetical protein
MLDLGQCVVIVDDGEVLAQVRVSDLLDDHGQARIEGRWVPVVYVDKIDDRLVFEQVEKDS